MKMDVSKDKSIQNETTKSSEVKEKSTKSTNSIKIKTKFKRKKDKNGPKHPLTGYFVFCS